MKLIGSTTSPYVRRIRLQLKDQDHEFRCVNIFTKEGQMEVAQYTTTGRIPLLVDDNKVIWDSFLIAQYLAPKPLALDLQKDLVLINEMTDAGVQLFQLRKFEIDVEDKGLFSKNNLRRIKNILSYFEAKKLVEWNILTQWLYCTLDWFDFRNVFKWRDDHPRLVSFYNTYCEHIKIKETEPRQN